MINYKKCSPNDIDDMFEAFTKGFSDYIVKFDITKERFIELFLNIEGNHTKYSFIAYDQDIPIGLILGGIKIYEGVKTLRCGTLAIDPQYRKQGVAQELFNRHYSIGIENGCQQLFLEVINGNDKAISFYLKQGYEIRHNIFYYQLKDLSSLNYQVPDWNHIKQISFDQALSFYNKHDQSHINWQNDFDYQKHFKNITYFGFYENDLLIGVLAISQTGKIFYLYVISSNRENNIANHLLSFAINKFNIENLNISITDNDELKQFLVQNGFVLQSLSQHEMYLQI